LPGRTFHYLDKKPVKFYITKEMMQNESWEILDATAGLRCLWIGRSARGALFVDKRVAVFPDVVASNEYIPFRAGIFRCILYDPPHVVNSSGGRTFYRTNFGFRFWAWDSMSEYVHNLWAVNREFARVLAPGGRLVFKHTKNPHGISLGLALALLSNFQEERRKIRGAKGGGSNVVTYVTLKRRKVEEITQGGD
jgi:SAM-dependent methyltransferase